MLKIFQCCIAKEDTTEMVVPNNENKNQLDTISESFIKDNEGDNTEIEDENKECVDETNDLKNMDESLV